VSSGFYSWDEFCGSLTKIFQDLTDIIHNAFNAIASKSGWRRLPQVGTSDSGFDQSGLEKYIWIVRSDIFG
jgi:hypothetical protein